jgi:signal transduction histidine kinase/CheY-like chemotaxis protein
MFLLVKHARYYLALVFGLIFVISFATIYLAIRAGEAEDWVSHTLKVQTAANLLLSALERRESGQLSFLITDDDRYLKVINKAESDILFVMSELRQLTADNPQQQAALNDFELALTARSERMRATLALAQTGRREDAVNAVKSGIGADLQETIQAEIKAFCERERALLLDRQSTSAMLRIWLLILIFSSLAGAIGLAAVLARQAQRGVNQLRQRTAELEAEAKLRVETESKLRHVQKLESVGQLTGGIAHDFNNLLTIILGNLDTLRRRLLIPSPDQSGEERAATLLKPVDYALQGARSAAQLTQRLLAFARQQPLEPVKLDVNELVSGLTELLRRTLGERITLESVLAGGLWPSFADANQVEAALINLCVNARDAMPDGGKLTIETSNAYLDEAYADQFDDVRPGQYVLLSVTDTGTGIAPEVLQRIFEPFFTTKPAGKGSGLGLAMVYGFVKQSGGHIRIYSELGEGTTVKIYLPRLTQVEETKAAPAAKPAVESPLPHAAPQEALLVVEDNRQVREYAKTCLEELGYTIFEAGDTAGALRILESGERIDLLFTDVVLPDESGRELSRHAVKLRPDLPILFTTGYTRNAIVHHGRLDADVKLLGKPYTQQDLARKIRELLDAGVS